MTASEFDTAIAETLQNVAEVVFFLLGALTIVEIMDAHKGFDIITSAIKATNQRDLLITIGVLTFLLSSVLNNLTVVIVMVSLLQRLVQDDDFRMKLGGLVVVASNAGGAWTPIGDITTTMLYIGASSHLACNTLAMPAYSTKQYGATAQGNASAVRDRAEWSNAVPMKSHRKRIAAGRWNPTDTKD